MSQPPPLRILRSSASHDAYVAGADDERTSVVEWLRSFGADTHAALIADAICARAHRRASERLVVIEPPAPVHPYRTGGEDDDDVPPTTPSARWGA